MLRRSTLTPTLLFTAILLAVSWLASACGPGYKEIRVVPEPAESEVYVDGELLGTGDSEYKLPNHDGNDHELKVCGPQGYFCAKGVINQDSRDVIRVTPPRDEGWFATTSSDAVGEWQTLGARDSEGLKAAWPKLVELIEGTNVEIDVLDAHSFYMRTAWKKAGSAEAESHLRSRLSVGLGGGDIEEVELRLKIETERVDQKGRIMATPQRTFPEFIEILEKARAL